MCLKYIKDRLPIYLLKYIKYYLVIINIVCIFEVSEAIGLFAFKNINHDN